MSVKRYAAPFLFSTQKRARLEEKSHGDWVSYEDYAALEAQLAEAQARPVGVEEAARVLLGAWLVGAFENGADAAADDAITDQWAHVDRTYPDASPIIEAWLRALSNE